MLGRRDPQQCLFSAQNLPNRVPGDSFYGRMAAVSSVLFSDDDLKEMYDAGIGRPSIPPSLMSGVLLLQYHDDVSDEEAVQRLQFDLRWQVALNLPTDFAGFDPSSLTYFRQRLIEHKQERYAFDRFVTVGREAGFIPDRVTLLTDTTSTKGAGAVRTPTRCYGRAFASCSSRWAMRRRANSVGCRPRRSAWSPLTSSRTARPRSTGLTPSSGGSATSAIPGCRSRPGLASEQRDNADVRATGWLLVKIMGDDIEPDDQGHPRIAKGTAPDRIISITDPEMRHGRKSSAQRFDGFKVAVTTEQSSEMILDIQDIPAAGSDGQELMPTIARVEQTRRRDGRAHHWRRRLWLRRESGCLRHAPGAARRSGRTAARPNDPVVDKSAFAIDLSGPDRHLPAGSHGHRPGWPAQARAAHLTLHLPAGDLRSLPVVPALRQEQDGRSHRADASLRSVSASGPPTPADRRVQRRLSAAPPIERKQAELVDHGLRNTRYLGHPKRQFQRLWQGAVANLSALFRLCASRKARPEYASGPARTSAIERQNDIRQSEGHKDDER